MTDLHLLIGQLATALIVGIGYTLPGVVARERPVTLGLITVVLASLGLAHVARLLGRGYPEPLQPLAIAVLFAYAGSAFAIGVRYFRRKRQIEQP